MRGTKFSPFPYPHTAKRGSQSKSPKEVIREKWARASRRETARVLVFVKKVTGYRIKKKELVYCWIEAFYSQSISSKHVTGRIKKSELVYC